MYRSSEESNSRNQKEDNPLRFANMRPAQEGSETVVTPRKPKKKGSQLDRTSSSNAKTTKNKSVELGGKEKEEKKKQAKQDKKVQKQAKQDKKVKKQAKQDKKAQKQAKQNKRVQEQEESSRLANVLPTQEGSKKAVKSGKPKKRGSQLDTTSSSSVKIPRNKSLELGKKEKKSNKKNLNFEQVRDSGDKKKLGQILKQVLEQSIESGDKEENELKILKEKIADLEKKEKELNRKNLELEQARDSSNKKENELKEKIVDLEKKEKELEALKLELVQERQQKEAKERELEAVNSKLLQEKQPRVEELEVENSRLVLELAQEKSQKEAKEKELKKINLKLKTSMSALLPIISSDEVRKEKPPFAQGGYGFVYRGKWLGEPIALKELINLNLTDDAIKEFEEEAFKMARLRSFYVVTVYGITLNDQGRLKGIVMEYMPQESLYKTLNNKEIVLSWLVRRKMALAVARGLSSLHQQNIIHNDLKSLNVLVRQQGDAWVLKLTDFGLSRIKQETSRFTGQPQGTPAWMAPELFEQHTYSRASDVYAYGIVLWEIVSRERPFKEKTDLQIMRSVCDKRERPFIPTEAPSLLVALMGLCWKQNKAERLPIKKVITRLKALPLKRELIELDNRDNAVVKLENQKVDGNISSQWSMG